MHVLDGIPSPCSPDDAELAAFEPLAPPPRAAVLLVAAWGVVVAAGLALVFAYGCTPGHAAAAPLRWPAGLGETPAPGQPTLLLFAHPRCPCTRASLRELERLVADVGGRLGGAVFLYRPADAAAGWERTDLAELAERIPGFDLRADPGGRIARSLGVATSGHAVVYDADGGLAFSGGITPGRGHEGDNLGRAAIRALVERGRASASQGPVFGCALCGPFCGECQP